MKSKIEEDCGVSMSIDSSTGEVEVVSRGDLLSSRPFKAVDIITAIARGFSSERASRLLDEEVVLNVVELRDYVGKSKGALERIKGRIIGLGGKSRRLIEELTGAYISIYGHTASVIGGVEEVELALDAIHMLASGSAHRTVYNALQRARSKAKLERMKLWEESS